MQFIDYIGGPADGHRESKSRAPRRAIKYHGGREYEYMLMAFADGTLSYVWVTNHGAPLIEMEGQA